MADIIAWCVDCGCRSTEADLEGRYACPNCGSEGIPCSPSDDLEIRINWHELHILVAWAENYAAAISKEGKDHRRAIIAIAKRLQEQFPSKIPLTLSGELAQLRQKFPNTEVIGPIQPDDDALPPNRN